MTLSTINKLALSFFVFLFLSQVEVNAQCAFSANQHTGCQGFQLNLTDITPGSTNTAWTITLANGTSIHTTNNPQASQLMTVCGKVIVTMTNVVGGNPCSTTDSSFVVNCKPVIKGRFSPSSACVGDNVCFLDSSSTSANCYPLKYIIDWGQSPLDTVPGCRRYTLPGTYCPSVIVKNSCGCQADSLFSGPNCIQINARPVASFTGSPLASCATPLTSTMTAQATGAGTVYKWYINGSAVATQSGASNIFTHSYTAGVYSIKLVVVNPITGCADTMSRTNYVSVGNTPASCYTASLTVSCAPKQVTYCPCNAGALSYVWSFPGSSTPNVTSATNNCQNVVYNSPGMYTSQLISYYNGGCVDTLTKVNFVSLGQPYTLGMISPDSFSCRLPDTVHLIYNGPPCGTCQFTWNPPGNLTPNSHTGTQVILNSYQSYTPILTVVDTFGCTSTLIRNTYIVAAKLKAKDVVTPLHNRTCIGDTVLVVNTTLGRPFASVTWSFPGANTHFKGPDSAFVFYGAAGCHKYTMIVQTVSGCIDTLRDSICIGPKPIITMTVDPHDICFEQICNTFTINVTAGSDTPTSVVIWPEGLSSYNITDIFSDTLSNCYFYQDFGTFTPCFVGQLLGCTSDTICLTGPLDSVHVKAPAAKFIEIFNCSNPNSVTYINESIQADSIWWNINGTIYTNKDTLTILYSGPCGTKHPVQLSAYNFSTQCTHNKFDTTIIPCLGVDFLAGGTRTGCFGSGYVDSVGIIYLDTNATHPSKVVWDVNVTAAGPHFTSPPALSADKISIALYNAGVYKVCAQLTYAGGCIDTLCKAKYVTVSKPIASFTVSDTAGCIPFTVHFTNTSVTQFATQKKFYWSFGDNSPVDSVTVNPTHLYDSVAAYIATLTIIDSNGCSSIATRQLIANLVIADFISSDSITCTANPDTLNPITFTNSSSGFVSHYQWQLPAALGPTNPTPGDVSSFSTRFTQQGSGKVCLIASDQAGICKDTICKNITVINPIADYTLPHLYDTFHLCGPVIINPFMDLSQNNICKCYWDFGDGSHYDTACDASHIYLHAGTYPVQHIVTSCHGCADTITKYTMHIKGPHVTYTSSVPGGCPCIPVSYYIRSYDTDSLEVGSGGGTPLFVNLKIPRGTQANPTLDTVTFTYCSVGDRVAYVLAFDIVDSNCVDRFDSQDTLAIDTPGIGFSHVWKGCGNDSICFTDITTYSAAHAHTVQRAWDFGDGSVVDSTLAPCHQYAAAGDYLVTLSVMDNVGCPNTITRNVHVPHLPVAIMRVDDTIGCVPLLLHFTDSTTVDDSTSIVSGFWNFGDGSSYNGFTDTSYTYLTANTPPATYTAMLVIKDGYGCADTATKQITVRPHAVVSTGPPQTICFGDTATLSGSGSPILHWSPVYNIDTTILTAPRVWPRSDTTYYLRAGDMPTCYVYDSVRVSVSVITASDTAWPLCLGQVTTLTGAAQSTHATVSSFFWHLGDGTTAAGPSVTHVYSAYGTFIDSLIITNSLGCRDTLYNQIMINDKPHAMIAVSDSILCLGDPVTVTNASTPGATTGLAAFTLDMQPDGVTDFTTSPASYTYPALGAYRIVLIQTDNNSCRDTAVQRVSVHSNPKAIFTGDSNCINLPNKLSGTAIIGDANITHYHWSINGVPQTSDSDIIYRAFAFAGDYNVCLSVSDTFGCKSPDTCADLHIISQPLDTISPLDTTICLGYSAGFHITGRFSGIQWVPSVWVDNPTGTDVVITPRQTIQYLIYANYGHCYPKIDTATIWVIDSVPVEAAANPENIVLGLSSNVTSTVKGTIDSIVWDPDTTLSCRNCRNPIATPKQTTTYTATIYYSRGGIVCSNRASVTITVLQSCNNSLIYVPNTFTPNNDNTNDVFRIRGQGISKVNYFRIFDRWGKVVYEASNADSPDDAAWNGGLNNDKARPENSGVFVYLFEIQCITGQTVTGKGNVTLIR